ncbi:hypothetical protein K439DRAFT_1623921 [Ramaria rubella]|nr:hypothetical protein K439DRAFT_1623921 [Ramaria rubella]
MAVVVQVWVWGWVAKRVVAVGCACGGGWQAGLRGWAWWMGMAVDEVGGGRDTVEDGGGGASAGVVAGGSSCKCGCGSGWRRWRWVRCGGDMVVGVLVVWQRRWWWGVGDVCDMVCDRSNQLTVGGCDDREPVVNGSWVPATNQG